MNKLDSALVISALKEAGFGLTEKVKEADIVLINTCSVREHAEQRVFSHIGHLKHIKEEKPDLVVGIIGCMAQRLGSELLKNGTVDIVCGPGQIPQIAELVKKAMSQKQKIVSVTENIRQADPVNQSLEQFESVYDRADKDITGQAFVRVMHGCDNFCSYCIVPYVRGREVSRPPEKIIEQIKKLAGEGIKLVTLLGQAVNKYKYTAGDKTYMLADLLYMVSEINGIEWIRFVTSYPQPEGFRELMKAMAELPKVCNYLHMPAQAGSDRILKAMNRKYTSGQYLELIALAREIVPSIAIAGDFIVGFSGETDEDFAQTVELVKKVRYRNCFVFKYSPRPGTAADKKLADTVPDEVKRQRNIELLAVQEKISTALAAEFLNKEVNVLVEGLSKKPHLNTNFLNRQERKDRGEENNDNINFACSADSAVNTYPQLIGRTTEDWIVVFNGPQTLAGQFAKVKIIKTSPLTLFGVTD